MVQAAPESTRGIEYALLELENTVWEANFSTGNDPVRGGSFEEVNDAILKKTPHDTPMLCNTETGESSNPNATLYLSQGSALLQNKQSEQAEHSIGPWKWTNKGKYSPPTRRIRLITWKVGAVDCEPYMGHWSCAN
jgi:hypothetical protein